MVYLFFPSLTVKVFHPLKRIFGPSLRNMHTGPVKYPYMHSAALGPVENLHRIKPLTFMLLDHIPNKALISFVISEFACARLRAQKTNKTKQKKTKKNKLAEQPPFLCFQKRLVKLDLPHTWLSTPPLPHSLLPSLQPSLGSKSLRGTDTASTIHHSSQCDSQTALLSWLNGGHASYAATDLHLCSVIHPEGIESSNPISRSPKCCPGETDTGWGGRREE